MLLVLAISGGWADDYPRNPQIDVQHYVFELALNDENDVIGVVVLEMVGYFSDTPDSQEYPLPLLLKMNCPALQTATDG